jgi:hypothetical protein
VEVKAYLSAREDGRGNLDPDGDRVRDAHALGAHGGSASITIVRAGLLAIVDSELQKTQFVLALAHSQRWFRLDNDGHRVFTNVLELLLHAKIALIHGLSP